MRLRSRIRSAARDAVNVFQFHGLRIHISQHHPGTAPGHFRVVPFHPGKFCSIRAPLGLHIKISPFDPKPRPIISGELQQRDLVMFAVTGHISHIFSVGTDDRRRTVKAVIGQRNCPVGTVTDSKQPVGAGAENGQISVNIQITAAIAYTAVNIVSGLHCLERLSFSLSVKGGSGRKNQSAAVTVPFQITHPGSISHQIRVDMSVP